jgi:hypothetical protein
MDGSKVMEIFGFPPGAAFRMEALSCAGFLQGGSGSGESHERESPFGRLVTGLRR